MRDVLTDAPRLLATILIGNALVNTAAAAIGFTLAESYFPHHGELVAVVAVTVMLLVFGEIGPKRIGLLYSQSLAVAYVPLVGRLIRLATPLRLLLESTTRTFRSLFRPHGKTLSAEEFRTVVDIGREEGIMNDEELGMVKAIIRLDDMRVADIMTPRVDIIGLEVDEDPAAALKAALHAKLNFLLMYRGSVDDVASLLDIRKYLLDPQHNMAAAQVKPMFVPQSMVLTRLLSQFQKDHRRVAIAVDEFGGTAGIVTRGDILEEISGDVFEEMSKPRPVFQQAGPHRWLVDANFALDELNRKLQLHFHAEDADRLAGWIAVQVGHLPQPNEVIETQGCRVTVLQTRRHRVTLAQIEKVEEPA